MEINASIKEMPTRMSNTLFLQCFGAIEDEYHDNLTIMSTDYVRLNASGCIRVFKQD